MATTVGILDVLFRAKTDRFEKGTRRAGKSVSRFSATVRIADRGVAAFGRSMLRAARSIGVFAAAITTGAVVALTALVKSQAEAIDSLAKTADKLGITTEALAGLQHAGKLTGNEVRTLNMGIQRMVRRVAEAAMGTGEAQQALKDLGLDAVKLAKLSPDKQFAAIAEAMAKVPTQGRRVQLAFKLFDSEGVALVNTLALGGRRLQELTEEAKRFGTAVSRIDAANVEAMNDAITRASAALAGIGSKITVTIAPVVQRLVNDFTEWSSVITSAAIKNAVLEIANSFDAVSAAANRWHIILLEAKQTLIATKLIMLEALRGASLTAAAATSGPGIFGRILAGLQQRIGAPHASNPAGMAAAALVVVRKILGVHTSVGQPIADKRIRAAAEHTSAIDRLTKQLEDTRKAYEDAVAFRGEKLGERLRTYFGEGRGIRQILAEAGNWLTHTVAPGLLGMIMNPYGPLSGVQENTNFADMLRLATRGFEPKPAPVTSGGLVTPQLPDALIKGSVEAFKAGALDQREERDWRRRIENLDKERNRKLREIADANLQDIVLRLP